MKAISLWQPWASLIACGAKPYETRHWPPPIGLIGQTIAIHAAKKIDRDAIGLAEDLMYGQHDAGGFDLADKLSASFDSLNDDDRFGLFGQAALPVGCVVCTAKLVGAYQCGHPAGEGVIAVARARPGSAALPGDRLRVDDFGDFAQGRWAWLFVNAKPLNPPPLAKGRQGIFELPQGWLSL